MKLIVGLGNPGAKYSKTRHNIGRLFIESLASEKLSPFHFHKKLQASVASLLSGREEVIVAYPEIFMNVSGAAIEALTEYYKIKASEDFLVVVDDFNIPFGKLRLRSRGSDGGHNGLKSIAASLGTSAYPRLRIGIGDPEGMPQVSFEDYVLSKFRPEEIKQLPRLFKKGIAACESWMTQGIEKAMNAVNS